MSEPAKPLIIRNDTKEPSRTVNIDGVQSRIGLRHSTVESKTTFGCVCSKCGEIFQVTLEEQYKLQEAKKNTGKRPNCGKCGGNEVAACA
jgi:NAD-dependent SIR2 family protein deacetylase